MKTSLVFFALALLGTSIAHAAPAPREGWDFGPFASTPVQIGGRLKPFDSFARDTVLNITGRVGYQGWDPSELMVSWISQPEQWENEEFILISRKDVKRQLGLNEDQNRFSPKALLDQSSLVDYANSSTTAGGGLTGQATPIARTTKPDQRNEEMKRVIDRVSLFRALVLGAAWQVVPRGVNEPWGELRLEPNEVPPPLDGAGANVATSATNVKEKYFRVFGAYRRGDQSMFETRARELHDAVISTAPGWSSTDARNNSLERFLNRAHPYQIAWELYLVAALFFGIAAWIAAALAKRTDAPKAVPAKVVLLRRIAVALTGIGFVIHVSGMILRCLIAGRPPVTNMYESVIWVSFGVLFFAWILYFRLKNTTLLAVASTLAVIGLIAADAAPVIMDPGIHPLVPVLRSNYWLTIHVMTITISYAAFALTMGIGNLTLYHYLCGHDQTTPGREKILVLINLIYRAMQFGVVLLAAGTILGGVWADYSWGRFWGWDPKEVWALIALMGYIIIIHARYTGWMREFGYAAWTVTAFSLVVMAWYGVNFVLGVGLHSYGFSSGGQSTMALFVGAQMAWVVAVSLIHKGRMAPKKAGGAV